MSLMPFALASSRRGEVGLDVFGTHRPGVSPISLVPARITTTGMQIDHILPEANQHLRGGLSAYAAMMYGLPGKTGRDARCR